jgi:hypothetical protein
MPSTSCFKEMAARCIWADLIEAEFTAVDQRKRDLGDDHPDTLASLNSLALLYDENCEYDRALPLLKECLAKRKRVLGDDHPDMLASLNSLAVLFDKGGCVLSSVYLQLSD